MGMKSLQAGPKAKEVRAKRYETAGRIVELAKRENVDFVLIAGDLFEHHDVDELVVKRTLEVLDRFAPIPVFILPGNHDPLVAGGVWSRQSWKRAGNHVRLMDKAMEISFQEGIALYPSPLTHKQGSADPTAWIPVRLPGDKRIRIGFAHGSLDILPEKGNFPIDSNRAIEKGLDYLALGDWHSFREHGKSVYSGTMEQTEFGEDNPGFVGLVEIDKAGAKPVISKHRTGLLRWMELHPDVKDETDVKKLEADIKQGGPLSNAMLRIGPRLFPESTMGALQDMEILRRQLLEDTFFLDWVEPPPTLAGLGPATLPGGILTNIDGDLAAIIDGRIPDGPGRILASEDKSVIEEARSLLHKFAGGGGT